MTDEEEEDWTIRYNCGCEVRPSVYENGVVSSFDATVDLCKKHEDFASSQRLRYEEKFRETTRND